MQNIIFHNVHTTFCSENMDMHTVFPYLTSSTVYNNYFISDSYIIQSYGMAFIVSIFFLFYNNSAMKTVIKSMVHQLKRFQQHGSLLVLLILVLISCSSTSYMMQTWYEYYNINTRLQAYNSCDNVDSGVATGTTFPVPHCFEDNTTYSTSSMDANDIFEECSWYEQPILLKGVSASICCMSFVILFGYNASTTRGISKQNCNDDNDIEFTNYSLFNDGGDNKQISHAQLV